MTRTLAHSGPVLIDAVVNRMELAMPPKVTAEMAKVTAEMAKGFTLCMVKASSTAASSSPDQICYGDAESFLNMRLRW